MSHRDQHDEVEDLLAQLESRFDPPGTPQQRPAQPPPRRLPKRRHQAQAQQPQYTPQQPQQPQYAPQQPQYAPQQPQQPQYAPQQPAAQTFHAHEAAPQQRPQHQQPQYAPQPAPQQAPQGGSQVEMLMQLISNLTQQMEGMRAENAQLRTLLEKMTTGGGGPPNQHQHQDPVLTDNPWMAQADVSMESPFGSAAPQGGEAPVQGPGHSEVKAAPHAAASLNGLLEGDFQSTEGLPPNDPALQAAWEQMGLLGVPNNNCSEVRPGRAHANRLRR